VPAVRRKKKLISPKNSAFSRAVFRINEVVRKWPKPKNFKWYNGSAQEVFERYGGRCALCGIGLSAHYNSGIDTLYLDFYIPLTRGGRWDSLDNVIPVCKSHYTGGVIKKELRKDIPDINTFSDLIEQLIRSTLSAKQMEDEDNPELSLMIKKKNMIKRIINMKLEDITVCMQYKPFEDWIPENYEFVIEDENTIPDLIEMTTESVVDNDTDAVVESKKKTTEQVKQLASTKQYRIVRNAPE
jgi:hypothetical protein